MGKVHFQQIQETEAVVDYFHLTGLVASAAAAASAVQASCCWESLNNVRRILQRVYRRHLRISVVLDGLLSQFIVLVEVHIIYCLTPHHHSLLISLR